MGEHTSISWTDHTWNPWQGGRKVSTGCVHCYAEALVEKRMGRKFSEIRKSSPITFNAPIKWKESALVFTCSISDFFIEEADAWRDEAWEIIRRTPHLTYQILTKRPERIANHLPETCFKCGNDAREGDCDCEGWGYWNTKSSYPAPGFWPNVWIGTSVENQKYAEIRIPQLVAIPAVVHFLSCEPLLGEIIFNENASDMMPPFLLDDIEWTIVGGESGPNFRHMDFDWARGIRDQCEAAGVPFYYKQGNGLHSEMNTFLDGKEWHQMPGD